MDRNPLTNLIQVVRKLKIVKHLKRQIFLVELVSAMIKSRSVIFSELAQNMEREALPSSIERRIQDFFQKVDFDYVQLLSLLLSFVPHQKMVLSIDRTEWDHGQEQYNILCVIASIGKMGVPLYFELLDNKSGNSNSEDRIRVLKQIIKIGRKERIAYLVMDREFIGQKWLSWLKQQQIDFCVRVPKHHLIHFLAGDKYCAEDLLQQRSNTYASQVIVDGVVVNLYVGKAKDGELLYLIGTLCCTQLKAAYRKRWSIEVFFQALKGRGFQLEKTGLRCPVKLRKLFAIACIAYTLCWATAIENAKYRPVKRKKHGYPQYSVFRRGLNIIRQALKKGICKSLEALWLALEQRLAKMRIKTIG